MLNVTFWYCIQIRLMADRCHFLHQIYWGRRDRMVVGFTTTYMYAISAYHHWCFEFKSQSRQGVQHYLVKFVSDLRQVIWWFSPGPLESSTIKIDRHNIAEILLKVALNNIKQTIRYIGFQSWLCRLVKM